MSIIYVGLSGGVDSAVSAALLKEAGHTVIGAFIKIWRPEFIDCPWKRDRLDAMRVAAALEIPFKEIDLSEEYKKTVIDDMLLNYARGITPNPDVLCNRHIKFGAFAQWAFEEGADMIATGHYAQIKDAELWRGKDTNKDQSYFLARLKKDDLLRTVFPVGGYTKPEVRALAEKFNLPVAKKADSQGLCFVGDVSMRDFLAQYIPLTKGNVFNEVGEVIGEHDGAALYTRGERHGFRVHAHSTHSVPQYIYAIDVERNSIHVSPNNQRANVTSAPLVDVQFVSEIPASDRRLLAQARYREKPVGCVLAHNIVTFDGPHLAPPGQTLALYDGDKLVGSGVISA